MKTKIILSLGIVMIAFAGQAQKIYSTKTGQLQFDASSPLEKIKGVNNQVDSKFNPANGQIVVAALIQSFNFENQLMEDHFNENYMESTKFPKADFKGYITDIANIDFSKSGNYPVTVDGTLTIHGQGKKINQKGELIIQNQEVTLTGEFNIQIKDFGIKGAYIGEKIAADANIKLNIKYQ